MSDEHFNLEYGPEHRAYSRASEHYRSGRYAEALRILLQLVSTFPRSGDLLHAVVLCHSRMDRIEEAKPYVKALSALGDPRAEILEADIRRLQGDGASTSSSWMREARYLVLPSLFLGVAFLFAAPELFLSRTLTFPAGESVGVLTGIQIIPFEEEEPFDLGEARGEVQIPRGVRVSLDATANAKLAKLPRPTTAWIRSVSIDSPTDGDLLAVSTWPRLEKLTLRNASRITDAGFAQVGQGMLLRELDVEHASISETAIAALSELDNLEHLGLAHCPKLGSAAFAELAALSGLTSLDITLPQFTNDDLAVLEELPKLESLRLAATGVSDTGIDQVLPGMGLKALSLARNPGVGDEALATLSRISVLEKLEIEGGTYSETGLAHLRAMPGLRVLIVFCVNDVATPGLPGESDD